MDMTQTSKKTARQKRIGVFFTVLQMLFIVAFVGLAVATFGTRIPMLAQWGINFFAVTSGSMEPAIPTGALIYTSKYNLDDLKKGDVITYRKTGNNQTAVVTHRIDSVDKKETTVSDKKTLTYNFHTKGDANSEPDNYTVTPGEIIGKYAWHLPYLGFVTAFAQTQQGFLLLVILPAAVLVIWEVISLVLHFKQEYSLQSEKEIAKLKAELEKAHTKDE